jgi:hypothetical protein
MSRSKHTDPRSLRAERRLCAPREERGTGDLSLRRLQGKTAKESGAIAKSGQPSSSKTLPAKPRVTVQRPQAGFHHPLGKREILDALDTIGPIAFYGLRSIELVRASESAGAMPTFGSYAPGRIVLYAQPRPPWRLRGLVTPTTARRLEKAGARITRLSEASATLVDWPEDTLHRYMLEEVLLHELGHHVLQHHKGKRPVRTARTRDHEAFASGFAKKQRAALRKLRSLKEDE